MPTVAIHAGRRSDALKHSRAFCWLVYLVKAGLSRRDRLRKLFKCRHTSRNVYFSQYWRWQSTPANAIFWRKRWCDYECGTDVEFTCGT